VALYAELDDNVERLREASVLKSRFLSYMSHEFRTPLSSIRSLARILLDRLDGPLTEEQEKQVLFMQSSAAELTEMVDDLLDLARIEAGRITISPAWFDMVDLFSALRGMFKPIITNEAVKVVFEEPAHDVPRLYTDDKKLSQILRNYISNALKFTMRGEVRVRAELNDDETVTFTVADTGIGIPEEQLKLLFQDFVQVGSPSRKTSAAPDWAWRSVDASLSCSVVPFPWRAKSAADRHSALGYPSACRSSPMAADLPPRILVVDDRPGVALFHVPRLALRGLYGARGRVRRRAVQKATTERIDLVVLDINLPDLNGYEVCRLIARTRAHCECR
jgi:CheY-like chemotaxis protein